MDREIEEMARRVEARAFLYGDPGSFRDGVRATLRELDVMRGSGERRDPKRQLARPSARRAG